MTARCDDVGALLAATLETLSKETGEARGLPNQAFTTESFLALEQDRLFPRCWTFAGRASAIPNAGDSEIVEVAGQPLILTRGDDNQIRVFQNVCPHRGARIMPASVTGRRTITCPYHGWSFQLDGSLAGRPHFDGPGCHDNAIKDCQRKDSPGLFDVRSAQWFDWIFVNLDGQAEAFKDACRPAMERIAVYSLDEFRFEAVERFEFDCNWKLVMENWIDMYHIFKVHPDLNSFMDPQARRGMSVDGNFIFNQYLMNRPSRAIGLEPAAGTEDVRSQVTFGLLFPNVGITVDASNLLFVKITPLAANRTQMEMLFYFPKEVATSPKFQPARETYRNWWVELNGEDEHVCHMLQLGRQCQAYDGGRFAPYWDQASIHFQRSIIETMSDRDG